MAAIDFPNSPTLNQQFTSAGRTWVWDGSVWKSLGVDVPFDLDGLSDVVIDTPAPGQALTYDGTDWVNSTVESLPTQTGNAGEILVTNGTAASWSNTVQANSASVPAIIVKGASSQSGNIQEWQDSTGAVKTAISSSGFINTGYADINVIRATSSAASTIPVVVKGASSQSGNLQEWQSNGGTVLASISSAGLLKAAPVAGVASTSASTVGYIGMPQNPEDTVGVTLNYTLTASDAGKHIYLYGTPGGAPTITIPANGTTAFEIGTTIVIINDMGSATNASIAITTDTLVLAGAGTTGTRTLARYGMATLVKVTATRWIISGNGLS